MKKSTFLHIYIFTLFSKIVFHGPSFGFESNKTFFSMAWFLCQFQRVDVNLSSGYNNLILNCHFLPFKFNTFTTLVDTKSKPKVTIMFCCICQDHYHLKVQLFWKAFGLQAIGGLIMLWLYCQMWWMLLI